VRRPDLAQLRITSKIFSMQNCLSIDARLKKKVIVCEERETVHEKRENFSLQQRVPATASATYLLPYEVCWFLTL
jgi:hypothetical protein